ncbi:MAG: hypothetical protein ACMUIE_00125 [Thermoplasmatota archaeon]
MKSKMKFFLAALLLIVPGLTAVATGRGPDIEVERSDDSSIPDGTNPGLFALSPGESVVLSEIVKQERGALFSEGVRSTGVKGISMREAPSGCYSVLEMEDERTRASDEEKERDIHDFPNGSKMTNAVEVIDGTLNYDPAGTSDIRDWFKFSLNDIDETANAPGGVHNVSLTINDLTDGNDLYTGLYELETDEGGNMTVDHADLIYLSVIFIDPWGQVVNMGGMESSFDDHDDGDGWTYRDNWSFNFVTPENSVGDEDPDGWANGLTEIGWYYVAISFNSYTRQGAPSRGAFTMKYSLEIDTRQTQDTDSASNTRETATTVIPLGEKYIHSTYQPVDWYRIGGSDPTKLWNITVRINRTDGQGFYSGDSLNGRRWDDWLHVFFVWRDAGDDGIWNNDDDLWYYYHHILSFFIAGGIFVANENQTLGYRLKSIYPESNEREAYLGLLAEPATYQVEDGVPTQSYYPFWTCWSEYTVDVNVIEELPNNPPTLSDIEVSSDWPDDETGGHYGTEFTINVTYTDADNDPPKLLELLIDPDTLSMKVIDMIQYEADTGDDDFTDGKVYSYSALGEDIGEQYSPHDIRFNASDTIPVNSIRTMRWTGPIDVNDAFEVWNDEPVYVDDNYPGIEPIGEDEPTVYIPLEYHSGGGMFRDNELSFVGFQIWNESRNDWYSSSDTELLHIDIKKVNGGGWNALITPKPNQNGNEEIRLRGFDAHSFAETTEEIVVEPENDPPIVLKVIIDGKNYVPENKDPYLLKLDLIDKVFAVEDEQFELEIDAEDPETEAEKQPLAFTYYGGDNWDKDPEVDVNTGYATMTPTNDDVKNGREKMVFEIDDGGFDGKVRLEVLISLENAQDDPTIEFPEIDEEFFQGDTIVIRPIARDIDPDETLSFRCNMEDEIDGETDPIVDQLPFAGLVEGTDWTFNLDTGELRFEIRDPLIWRETYPDEVTIRIVIEVMDSGGNTASASVDIILKPEDFPVPGPDPQFSLYDDHSVTPMKIEGLRVHLWQEPKLNFFGERYACHWQMDDEGEETGWDLNYTFDSYGMKNVTVWLQDDYGRSDEVKVTFTLQKYEEPKIGDDDDDNGSGGNIGLYVVLVVIALIILLAAILFFVFRRRAKPAEEEYYDEDRTHHLGGGERHGLHPGGHAASLSASREERREHLPPKRSAPEPEPQETTCPTCGSRVKKGWFLCPDCKNPL